MKHRILGWALALSCLSTLVPTASMADVCDSPVKYSDDAKSSKWLNSNACLKAGDILSDVGQSMLNTALSAYGIPGFSKGDSFDAHAKEIIDEIQASRKAVIDEMDAYWQEFRTYNSVIAATTYTELLQRTDIWFGKSITAKIANPSELDGVLADLIGLQTNLEGIILERFEASPENPTTLTEFPYFDLLHVYAHTVSLRAAAEAENVHVDELAGRIQTCASDPRMSADVAAAQVNYCVGLLSPAARAELERTVQTQSTANVTIALQSAIAFTAAFANDAKVLQTVFEQRFGEASGGASGAVITGSFVGLVPRSGVASTEKVWVYKYHGKTFSIEQRMAGGTSTVGYALGPVAQFDGFSVQYGSVEEAFETHRRRVYHEMLVTAYAPYRLVLEHWWEELRALGAVSGYRPVNSLDKDLNALAMGQDAPGYRPNFTGYATRDTRGTWRPTWDENYGADGVNTLVSGSASVLGEGHKSLLISGAIKYGGWYPLAMYWSMVFHDPLYVGPAQPWFPHEQLIREHFLVGQELDIETDLPVVHRFYKGQFAAKFVAVAL